MKKQLLDFSKLTESDIYQLIEKAKAFSTATKPIFKFNNTAALLFYENSTRTKISFELALKRLTIPYVDLNINTSSEKKGETTLDTLLTLGAMQVDTFIIRHKDDNLIFDLADKLCDKFHFINAGSGMRAHPTQALLDVFTIFDSKKSLTDLSIAIIGDLKHSRVVASLLQAFKLCSIGDIRLCAPADLAVSKPTIGSYTADLKEALQDADVIITLRVQKERLQQGESINLKDYQAYYRLDKKMLAYAKPDAIIMHPGPINRDIEITSEVAYGPQSMILKQVENGVYMRQAILEWLYGTQL